MPHQYENGKPKAAPIRPDQLPTGWVLSSLPYSLQGRIGVSRKWLLIILVYCTVFLFNFMFWKTTWKWFPFTDGGQFPSFPFLWESYETKNNSPKEKTDIMEKKSWHQYMFLLYCHLCLCSHEHSIQFVYSACQKWIDICRRRIEFKWNNQKISQRCPCFQRCHSRWR